MGAMVARPGRRRRPSRSEDCDSGEASVLRPRRSRATAASRARMASSALFGILFDIEHAHVRQCSISRIFGGKLSLDNALESAPSIPNTGGSRHKARLWFQVPLGISAPHLDRSISPSKPAL